MNRQRLDNFYDTGPQMNAVSTELVSRMLFDMDYGLFDHENKGQDTPLAAILYHPAEDLIEGSMHFEMIRNYRAYDIRKSFGLSLEEYRNLPIHEYHFINDLCYREMQEKVKDQKRIAEEMNEKK